MTGSVLAIDHGTKRTGFALADPLHIVVRPLEVWHGDGDSDGLVEHVALLVEEYDAQTLLLGWPLHMDGREGGQAARVGAFEARLRRRLPQIALERRDERLTTKEAEDLLRAAGHHGDARKARRDSWSALVILREWVEAQ